MRTATEALLKEKLPAWGRAHRRSFPWREETDPFRVLVAEMLLQRSRGSTVAGVYRALFERWPDAERLARAQVRSIAAVIRPLGLTKRADALKALAQEVVKRGGVPRTPEELMGLPGIGRYAAHATMAVAFGKRVPTVDGVSARVYRRYFGLPDERPPVADRELWEIVERVTPMRGVREWNWSVLDLAATVCLPRRPRCHTCPLVSGCVAAQGSVAIERSRSTIG